MAIHIFVTAFIILVVPLFCIIKIRPEYKGYRDISRNELIPKNEKISNNFLLIVSFAVAQVLLLGLRDFGGADDESYRAFYDLGYGAGAWYGFLSEKEPFFILFRTIGLTFELNYKFLFLLYAMFQGIVIVKALRNYFNDVNSTVLYIAGYFFLTYSSVFTVMRQASAMAIIFYYYSLSEKERDRWWLLLAILAFFNHYASILVIVIELLRKLIIRKRYISKITKILVPIMCLILGNFIDFQAIFSLLGTLSNGLYSYMDSTNNFLSSAKHSRVITVLFIVYCFLVISKSNSENKERTELLETLQMIYFSLAFLALHLNWGSRIELYYKMFQPFIIIDVVNRFNKQSKLILTVLICITLLFLFAVVIYSIPGIANYKWSLNFKK
ncbi:EpsG family protein [Paenibacillus koleovorans]|uniref:EpsG family protein n=1 Tax=Paenibacillus koleovorans TaxID=121608 RepID=UPI000FD76CF4|nr:EpsG family protein [Paenibacillus koleovorans]